jgi:hypothetical protein
MKHRREVSVHIHIHEGASPDAVRAAVEAAGGGSEEPVDSSVSSNSTAELVRRSYEDSVEKAKPLLDFLAANPDREIPYTEVSEYLGFKTSRSLPGLLGAFSRRADYRYGGFQPFAKKLDGDVSRIVMPAEYAAIINEIRSS